MTDLHELAMKIRYDITSAQSRLTELIKAVDAIMPDAKPHEPDTCEICFVGGGQHAADCQALLFAVYVADPGSRARVSQPKEAA